ncbi:MAG: UxaA family hydrolase, partial [Gemmatimonadaceae bacterium]|nr:UxaA family hydrolase [Gemmatimonadaceae bacterium]
MTAPTAVRRAAVRVHDDDDVAVAVRALVAGDSVDVGESAVRLATDVPAGHKFALHAIAAGDTITKYGFPIGIAIAAIDAGDWIHSHNLRTGLEGLGEYRYAPGEAAVAHSSAMPTFEGYHRDDGRTATRNEIWILNTVGCVNFVAEGIARSATERLGSAPGLDGIHAFGHPFGCSQLGDDLANTQKVLAGLLRNPNAGGVLVLGLGCENNQMDALLTRAGTVDRTRLRFFNTQDVMDERDAGLTMVAELAERMREDRRSTRPASELVLGHKCGGSDGFSGIS